MKEMPEDKFFREIGKMNILEISKFFNISKPNAIKLIKMKAKDGNQAINLPLHKVFELLKR